MWCELATDFYRLEEISGDWTRWMRQDPSASIFQSWEWVRAFWKAYGSGFSLCSLIVHGDKGPVGVLPLMRKGHTIQFLAAPESDYNDLLCEKGEAVAVLETALGFLLRSSMTWTSLILEKIPAHSKIYRSVNSLSRPLQKYLQLVYRCPSPAIVVEQNRRTLDGLMGKEQLVRYQKKLQKLGTVSFRHLEKREEVREHLDSFFNLHVARWAMARVRSQFLQPEARTFYEELVDSLDPRDQLRFGVLEVDSRPIAYHFGFQHKGTLTWYKPAFDVNYWDYCPGDVLLRSLFQHVKEFDLNELDFTIGDEPFKFRFANRVRQNYILYVDRQPGALGDCFRSVVRSVQHSVRQKPALKAALKRKIALVQDFAECSRGLIRRGTVLRNCQQGLRTMRGWLWSFEDAFLWMSPEAVEAKDGVTIRQASLRDLAYLSSEFDYFLTPAQLHRYRRLLKQGDRAFIARTFDGETFVLFVGRRREIEPFTAGADRKLQLSEPVQVIVECWKAPEPSRRYVPADVLRAMCAFSGTELWIYHVGSNDKLKRAVEEAGMEFRHRLVRHTLMRSSRYTRLESSAPNGALAGKPVVKGVVGASS